MEYITLKNSDLRVSRVCMGGCPMGQHGWGKVLENELLDAVNVSIDNGINFFDTADIYGLGKSEEILAKALGIRRHQVVIATKFGVRIIEGRTIYDNSPSWLEEALVQSLTRLETDYIDLYQIHNRDGKTPFSVIIDTLEKFKKKGYIRYYGLSNIHSEDVAELSAYAGQFVSMQDEYSLACRKNEGDLTEIADVLKVAPMTWGSLGQGILTGKYDRHTAFDKNDRRSRDDYVNFHGDKLLKNLEIVNVIKPIAEIHCASVSAVAIRFVLDYLKNSVVIVGAKRPSQILENIGAIGWNLSDHEIRMLDVVSR